MLRYADELGVDPDRIEPAVRLAAKAQLDFEEELERIGDEALAYARENKVPAVLLVGHLHVICDPAINANIPLLLRRNGAMAIPSDCFAIPDHVPPMKKIYWGDANRALRGAVYARELGDVFPVQLASFGCGPSSFTEQIFQSLLEGYPHTVLESDGHGGEAGFITRIQAFLQSVRQFIAEDARDTVPDNTKAPIRMCITWRCPWPRTWGRCLQPLTGPMAPTWLRPPLTARPHAQSANRIARARNAWAINWFGARSALTWKSTHPSKTPGF